MKELDNTILEALRASPRPMLLRDLRAAARRKGHLAFYNHLLDALERLVDARLVILDEIEPPRGWDNVQDRIVIRACPQAEADEPRLRAPDDGRALH